MIYEDYVKVPVSSIVLEEIRFQANRMLSEELITNVGGLHSVSLLRDFIYNSYIFEIKSKFYAKKQNFDLPATPVTWWDHFKRDAIPTFSRLLRLTINEKRETLLAATIFPDVPQLPGGRFYYHEVQPRRYEAEHK